MKKYLMIASLGLLLVGTAFAEGKTSPEAKEIHAAKFISCVNAKVMKITPVADLSCDKFKNLDKAVQGYNAGKKPRGLSAAATKLEKADVAGLTEAEKKLIAAAKATEVYQKMHK